MATEGERKAGRGEFSIIDKCVFLKRPRKSQHALGLLAGARAGEVGVVGRSRPGLLLAAVAILLESPYLELAALELLSPVLLPAGLTGSASLARCRGAAMHSLVFLCAQKVVSHHGTLRGALAFLPQELYPVLFKAAFLDKRTPALQDLVQTWPFPVLSFQKLLRKCQHCERALIRERPNKLCIQTVILGVVTSLVKMLEDRHRNKR